MCLSIGTGRYRPVDAAFAKPEGCRAKAKLRASPSSSFSFVVHENGNTRNNGSTFELVFMTDDRNHTKKEHMKLNPSGIALILRPLPNRNVSNASVSEVLNTLRRSQR